MFQGELRFDFFNGLARFNRSGAGQAANQESAGLNSILQVRVCPGKGFLLHAYNYSKILLG